MKKLRIAVCVLFAVIFCLFINCASPQIIVRAESGQKVHVGGFPIGIALDVGGLLVENVTGVETEFGSMVVEGLQKGDIIKKIDGVSVDSADDISDLLDCESVEIELVRNGETINVTVTPVIEIYTGKLRLGIKVKDKIYGVGTVSYVTENGNYAALGHEIYDAETGIRLPLCTGKLHACKILGIKHGKKGEAGAILASINSDCVLGSITCNNNFGIAGKYTGDIDHDEVLPIGTREDVHPGAAKIRTTVDKVPEYFDIEIIKASKQSGKREKSLVFRVTDERLIKISGGVVRGMSGSPIVQDGKVVGAVTHVFLNDFTKGYGVYVDCLNAA